MDLNRLPSNIAYEVKMLTDDDQFQKKFSEDKLLDYLEAQKHDKAIEFQQLQLLLYKRNMIGGVAFKPITMALNSYLYCLESNIIKDVQKITMDDLDVFFYLLQTQNYTYDVQKLLRESHNFCKKQYNMNFNQAVYVFNQLSHIELKVLKLFPQASKENEQILNVDWMLGILSKVKPYTSYTTEQLYTKVSIMEIYYWYAQYRKNHGDNSIVARNNDEINDEMDSRMIELVVQRLIQKGILDSSKKQEYFDLMKNNNREEQNNG